jgi:hypothetical protein
MAGWLIARNVANLGFEQIAINAFYPRMISYMDSCSSERELSMM